jgi:hypothetical protein
VRSGLERMVGRLRDYAHTHTSAKVMGAHHLDVTRGEVIAISEEREPLHPLQLDSRQTRRG